MRLRAKFMTESSNPSGQLTEMAQLGEKPSDHLTRPGSCKRKRHHSDDKDDEDIMPPAKQAMLVSLCTAENTILDDSPLLPPSDDDDVIDFTSLPQSDSNEAVAAANDNIYSDDNEFSPHYDDLYQLERYLNSDTSQKPKAVSPQEKYRQRKCPFPSLSWADHCDVWHKMCEGDLESSGWRTQNLFKHHPGLQLRMRAILLDWLIEVCEVYKLYRETFHLTVNYIDRYLSNTEDVYKGRLQLIGITCLFIAAKVEEVYPPKIGEFAYVTDGACTAEDILTEEIVILQTLSWRTTPLTINKWLNAYMQLNSIQEVNQKTPIETDESQSDEMRKYTFIFPQYSSLEYVICGQLIDLAVLHVGVNAFSYSLMAAAAVAHIFNKEVAMRVSSFLWEELSPCYVWLAPFAEVLGAEGVGAGAVGGSLPDCGADFTATGGGLARICPNINLDQSHRIQVHNICLDLFDKAQQFMETTRIKCIESTPTTSGVAAGPTMVPITPITPPYSGQKMADALDTKTPTQVAVDK